MNSTTNINSEGDNYFGGSDIDRMLFRKIVFPKMIEAGYKVDDVFDETTSSGKSLSRKIQLDCETCKIELSSKNAALLEIFDIDDDNGEPIEFEHEITRGELEALISDTVDRSIAIDKASRLKFLLLGQGMQGCGEKAITQGGQFRNWNCPPYFIHKS